MQAWQPRGKVKIYAMSHMAMSQATLSPSSFSPSILAKCQPWRSVLHTSHGSSYGCVHVNRRKYDMFSFIVKALFALRIHFDEHIRMYVHSRISQQQLIAGALATYSPRPLLVVYKMAKEFCTKTYSYQQQVNEPLRYHCLPQCKPFTPPVLVHTLLLNQPPAPNMHPNAHIQWAHTTHRVSTRLRYFTDQSQAPLQCMGASLMHFELYSSTVYKLCRECDNVVAQCNMIVVVNVCHSANS